MDWLVTENMIDADILEIQNIYVEPIERYNAIILYCQKTLEGYRQAISDSGFQNKNEEIEFFKVHKPHVISLMIQYKKQLSFVLEYPAIPDKQLERTIKNKFTKINSFLSLHRDFICYLKLDKTFMDEIYFLRKNKNMQSCLGQSWMSFDPNFSTSHDFLIAAIHADMEFQKFLLHKLFPKSHLLEFEEKPLLKWTASKVALTELGFALFHSGAVQNGNIPLKDMMLILEKITGTDLGNYHHTSTRFRNRNNPTKFIDKMKKSLLNWMATIDD